MKLPQFFRKLMYISIWVFAGVSIVPFIALPIAGIFHITVSERVGTILLTVGVAVWVISFIGMMGSMAAAPLIRWAENAGLRSVGTSATATILDSYKVTEGQTRFGPNVVGARYKLRVRTPQGETFEAVTEVSTDEFFRATMAGMFGVGKEVPVKYDPLTKEVALIIPKKQPKPKKPTW